MEPSPDPRRDEFDFEWCLSVEDVRALYNIICYSIETWPGSPRRPPEEQEYLKHVKNQLFAMLADYSFTELDTCLLYTSPSPRD